MVRSCGVWAVLGAVLWTVPASGAECGSAGRPWVKVTFASSFGTAAVQARIVEDFRAGLSDRAIDVCGGASLPSRPALAGVHIASTTATRVGVSVEVRDALTEKRLTRDVDLSSVPEDGKAFAVAVAADELLRASWVELALEREGRLPRKPPREVVEIVNSTLSRSTNARTARLGVRGAAERFTGG